MNVVFKHRDYTETLPLPASVQVRVERYSHHMIGGPETADLVATPGADKWDVTKLLRCPVEIWDEGKCLWWGYVNRVVAPNGPEQRVGLGLDGMYNHVTVAYTDGDTAAASNVASIAEYGQKEIRLSDTNATQTEAEQARDLYLEAHYYAPPEIEFSGGKEEISIECYGWYNTLGWKYYSDTDSTNTENTTQILNMVTGAGQFLAGTVIENTAGITSDENRDGYSTALTYINQLLNAGTSNVRPLLARVDKNRYLHVYERQAETTEYLLRGDGKLETLLGKVLPDKECKVAAWVRVKDAPNTLGGFSALRPAFIERAEYNAERERTTYRFASAYEQTRMSRYVADVISGTSSGGSTYNPYLSLPYVPTVPAPRPRLHRTEYLAISGITVSDYVPITGAPVAARNTTYSGLLYLLPTTVTSEPAWKVLIAGIYDIRLWLEISCTSVTQGSVGITVLTGTGVGGSILFDDARQMGIASGGSNGYLAATLSFTAKLGTVGHYLSVRVTNSTDAASVQVDNAEMIATFERAA